MQHSLSFQYWTNQQQRTRHHKRDCFLPLVPCPRQQSVDLLRIFITMPASLHRSESSKCSRSSSTLRMVTIAFSLHRCIQAGSRVTLQGNQIFLTASSLVDYSFPIWPSFIFPCNSENQSDFLSSYDGKPGSCVSILRLADSEPKPHTGSEWKILVSQVGCRWAFRQDGRDCG